MSQGNARRLTAVQDVYSGIPQPSSALKKRPMPEYFAPPPPSRPGRVSIAPVAGGARAPLGQSLSQPSSQTQAGPSNNLRMSMLRSQPPAPQGNPLGGSRGTNRNPFGQTPLRNPTASVRKQQAHLGSTRISMAPTFAPPSMSIKDTRPIRDKSFQMTCQRDIYEYLQQRGYKNPLAPRTLHSPSNKDFRDIFIFLINDVIDPHFQWGRAGRKIEDDIMLLLRDHKYRGVDSISKSSLAAVATIHAWPAVLAMLHWLVNLSLLKLRLEEDMVDNDPWLPAQIEGDGKPRADSNPDTVVDDYIAGTYRLYLSGEDQFPDQVQALEDFFYRRRDSADAQAEADSVAADKAASELQMLLSKPTELVQTQRALEEAEHQKEQYTSGIETTQRKDVRLIKNMEQLKLTIEEANQKMQNLEKEEEALQGAIAAQPITAEEMQRMAAETEKLQRNLRDTQARIREATRANNSSEVSLSHRLHQLDGAVTEYNEILWRLGLYRRRSGDDPMDHSKEDVDDADGEFEIELNPAASVVGDMLRGGGTLDGGLKHRVQPSLNAFAAEAREARAEIESEQLAKESEVDRVKEDIEHIGDEADLLRRKIEVAQDKAEEMKSSSALVTGELREEIERLEREVASMGAGAQSALVNAQARLSAVENEFKDIQFKAEQLKRQTHDEITKQTALMLDFREQVMGKLEELRLSALEQ